MKKIWIGVGVACALVLTSCGGSTETKKAEDTSAPAASAGGAGATPDEANGGTITGKVAFDGAKPTMKNIDMSAVPYCTKANPTPAKYEDAVVNDNGTLKNVFVWVKSGLPDKQWQVPTTPVLLNQNDCTYKPHVIGVMAGQQIDIKNSDNTFHNVHGRLSGKSLWNKMQAPHDPDLVFDAAQAKPGDVVEIQCNVHPWMHAYAVVTDHPYFAITKDDGSFEIKGLPEGDYTLEAWHPVLGTRSISVKIGKGKRGQVTARFAYKPEDAPTP